MKARQICEIYYPKPPLEVLNALKDSSIIQKDFTWFNKEIEEGPWKLKEVIGNTDIYLDEKESTDLVYILENESDKGAYLFYKYNQREIVDFKVIKEGSFYLVKKDVYHQLLLGRGKVTLLTLNLFNYAGDPNGSQE